MKEKKIFRVNPIVLILLLMCVMAGVVLMFYGSIASIGREEEPSDVVMRIIGAVIFVVVGGIAVLLEHKSKKRHIDFLSKRQVRANDALESVLKLVSKVKEDSAQLSYLIDEIEETLGKSMEALSNIKESGDRLSEEVDVQTKAVYNIKKTVAKADSKTDVMAEFAKDSLRIIGAGCDNVKELKKKSDAITDSNDGIKRLFSGFMNKLSILREKTGKIGAMSAQTNLLSLNASVECARAGSAGRGFVVTADEIRGLSDSTKKLTDEIDIIAKELEYGVTTAGKYMGAITEYVAEENTMIECTNKNYEQLSETFNDLYESIAMTGKELQRISNLSEEIIGSINEVAATQSAYQNDGKLALELGENNFHRVSKADKLAKELADAVEEIERHI